MQNNGYALNPLSENKDNGATAQQKARKLEFMLAIHKKALEILPVAKTEKGSQLFGLPSLCVLHPLPPHDPVNAGAFL